MEKRRRKDKTRTKHKQDLIAAGQEKMEQPAAVSKGASQLAEVTFAAGGLQGGRLLSFSSGRTSQTRAAVAFDSLKTMKKLLAVTLAVTVVI